MKRYPLRPFLVLLQRLGEKDLSTGTYPAVFVPIKGDPIILAKSSSAALDEAKQRFPSFRNRLVIEPDFNPFGRMKWK